MTRHVAFLRAINVGGRNLKMAALVALFESLKFTEVSTFIASGTVVFRSGSSSPASPAQRIEAEFQRALGYEVATFLRTDAHVFELAGTVPFPKPRLAQAQAPNVAFLAGELNAGQVTRLHSLGSPVDEFIVQGNEVFWLCRVRQSESTFSNAVFERALGV